MNTPIPLIWVLADDRAGNVSQSLGVAEALGLPFVRKDIAYNGWAKSPNIIRSATLLGVDGNKSTPLTPPWPDLVIAAGRRTAPVARYIKKQSGGKSKLVQIMWPGFPAGDFDLVAVPEHDKKLLSKPHNIIRTIGAPHRVTEEVLQNAAAKWYPHFSHLPARKIALLVGGSTKRKKFAPEYAKALGEQASKLAENAGAGLLVTTSRRTSPEATKALLQQIRVPFYVHQWNDGRENPYFGFLALSQAVVVTGDSMSMCSEACATGKPVYIYAPKELTSNKHKRFHTSLFAGGYAKSLGTSFELWHYPPLQASVQVAGGVGRLLKT